MFGEFCDNDAKIVKKMQKIETQLDLRAISWLVKNQKLGTLLISQLRIFEYPLLNNNGNLSAPILILGKQNSWVKA